MIYILKFGASFILPPGIFFVTLAAIAAWAWRRGEKKISCAILSLTFIFYLLSTSVVADSLLRSLESRYTPPSEPYGDVIVVLGGGATKDTPDICGEQGQLTASPSSRLLTAARLYRVLRVPIILSGGQVYADSGPEAWIGRRVLIGLGVDENDIILETDSLNTTQNAIFSSRIIRERGFREPVLVTSAFHMPRAVLCFESRGVDVVPFPADFQANREARDFHYSRMRPSSDALAASSVVLQEKLRMLVTLITGR
ncbi:MAG: YdcF family protein [Schwartzia sp.]|nr:YdcF family protein [Schwartzia sp. (in: firmicutes)]